MVHTATSASPTFIDLFAGCGGLSLGLSQAGWQGLFAIERASDAFKTFDANFLQPTSRHKFNWPEQWLDKSAHSIDDVLKDHRDTLGQFTGKVDLVAGGPPCQGFSFAGRRNAADPRNRMFERYVSFVDLIRPRFLVLENVPGMDVAHSKRSGKKSAGTKTYYEKLESELQEIGYVVAPKILDPAKFGVPQRRARLVVVGMEVDTAKHLGEARLDIFRRIEREGEKQLSVLGNGQPVTAEQALSDLAISTVDALRRRRIERQTIKYRGDGARNGYVQLGYSGPGDSRYQRLMNEGVPADKMDSMRLARHRDDVAIRFKEILDISRKANRLGRNLSAEERERLGMLKHRTVPMAPDQPAPTLTTLPDDILHYSDARILTVREYARLQSFPDWFTFHGKYTTGGKRRKVECPRYTQVGNAVPPLLAKAIGTGILAAWQALEATKGAGLHRATNNRNREIALPA